MGYVTEADLPPLLAGDVLHIHDIVGAKPAIIAMLFEEPGPVGGVVGSRKRFFLKYLKGEEIQKHVSDIALVYGLSDVYRSGEKIWSRLEKHEIGLLWEEMRVK